MISRPVKWGSLVRVSVVILMIAFSFMLINSLSLKRFDLLIYDYLLNWQNNQLSDEIVIVAIDDASLQAIGRWPWSRSIHAQLLERLSSMHAKVIAFDVLFSEHQTDDLLADQQFSDAIAGNAKTVLAVAPANSTENASMSELIPIPVLAGSAAALGHVDYEIDIDGLCRSFYLYAGLGNAHWPAFSLAILEVAGRAPDNGMMSAPETEPGTGWVRRGHFFIPFDTRVNALKKISYYDVLHNDDVISEISGKYVLIGSTATGLGDVFATPVSSNHQRMPGIELNAHVLSGLLNGRLSTELSSAQYQIFTAAIVTISAILMVTTAFPFGLFLFLALLSAIIVLTAILLYGWQIWFPPAAAIAPVLLGFPLWGAWTLFQEKGRTRSLTALMQHQASHHSVTDLPNQYVLLEALQELTAHSIENADMAALLIVHIKWSGSTGTMVDHTAGEPLLCAISSRLSDAVRSNDLVAHLNGDDFALLVRNLSDTESGLRIADDLTKIIKKPIEIDGTNITLTPRIGMCFWSKGEPAPDTLLSNAYIAMFRARLDQTTRTCVFTEEVAREVQTRSHLEQALLHALERNEFEVYYQPQVISHSGRIIGVEALLRWNNPELGLVYPGTFIPVAEQAGLIQAIGGWVLTTACTQVQNWNEQGLGPVRLAVNLSPLQFADQNLVTVVSDALRESGFSAASLELEITESAIMKNLPEATSAMRLLKNNGVKLAIDDFGTGYSSLSHLQHFPVDRIKIDQSFVREMQENQDVREITLSIISMAKRLKLEIIAEGVETEIQADILGEFGCDELQGFYFGHPLPERQLKDLLSLASSAADAVHDKK